MTYSIWSYIQEGGELELSSYVIDKWFPNSLKCIGAAMCCESPPVGDAASPPSAAESSSVDEDSSVLTK